MANSQERDRRENRNKADASVPQWWCNFCGYSTGDSQAYLKHSCVDELAKRGTPANPSGSSECR